MMHLPAWLLKYASYVPKAIAWIGGHGSTAQAEGITSRVMPPNRNNDARIKCKIHVDLANKRTEAVRFSGASFTFSQHCPLKPDPKWAAEIGGRYVIEFRCPPSNLHECKDIYLRPGEQNDIWIGIDPAHPDDHIKEATSRHIVGELLFQLTTWDEKGKPKMREVRVAV